ncbi:MAG: tetratricopeptide repeat protein, partial [Usitatibacter sp.]
FAFHAVKTGRGAMWVTIILVFPVVGCLAYYFMEVFPGTREQRQLRRHIHDIAKALNPDGELQRRADAVTDSASVENRSALADECLEKGMFDEAIRLYEGCLEGVHRNDARILFSCARAYYYDARHRQAEEILARLEKAHPRFRPEEVRLLQARVLDALGDTPRALAIFEALRTTYVGFEAKYRHAELLRRLGRDSEARELFSFIAQNARRSALESEQEWVKLARRELEKSTA